MQKKLIKGAFLSSLLIFSPYIPAEAAADFNSHFSAGETAFASQNFTAAADNFASALKYVPEDLRSRFRYGQALFSLNRFSESHSQFQAVLQNSPSNIIARVYLAENLVRLQRAAEARTQLEWILRVQPGHQRARQLLDEIGAQSSVVPDMAVRMPERQPGSQQSLPVKTASVKKKGKPVKSQKAATNAVQTARVLPAAKTSGNEPAQSEKFAPQPFVAGKSTVSSQPASGRNVPAQADSSVSGFDLDSFLALAGNSLVVNIELARYGLERDDTRAAAVSLLAAEQLARESKDSRRFLEVQILNSLVLVYNRDFTGFGQHLMQLKSVLSPESYQSFLDIYNQGAALKDPVDQARLVSGIAMGAGHYAIAARLLAETFQKRPDDLLIGGMLADAQLQSLNYKGAEATLSQLARTDGKNGEVWFNLARFYLTADYRPEQVRSYATHAAKLRPDDSRNSILLALLDYSEGKITAGVDRIKALFPTLKDPALKGVCERIISDGQVAGNERIDFRSVLALPGAPHSAKSSLRMLGEDCLKQGSFFTAMNYFKAADDTAEIGRTWLGIASALHSAGEASLAAKAAGYGLKAIHHELAANPGNSRANLYLALYHYERDDRVAAHKAIERGLSSKTGEAATRKRLTAILNAMNS